ncbi:MAG: Gfo/Idh/MocA family oxidoreductase [Bacteroidales bacterium]|nr:Gfo/Idh/MocA family oxidoreductase [Bacteroidales bacterium]
MKKINFAVVGAGRIGKRHISIIEANANADLCAVCDIRPREVTGIDSRTDYYNSISEMLGSHPEIDIVNVCTPNSFHSRMAVEVLNAGYNVLVEKPLALSVADAREVVDAEKRSGKKVFCVSQNRFSPSLQWIKLILDKQCLGRVNAVNVYCLWNRDNNYYNTNGWHGTQEFDGGVLYTQFAHFIDILLWLFGTVKSVDAAQFSNFAHQSTTEFEDTGSVLLTLDNGASVNFMYTTAVAHANFESSIIIMGSKGTIKLDGQYMDHLSYCNIPDCDVPSMDDMYKSGDQKPTAMNHNFVIQNVIDTLNGVGNVSTTAAEGMAISDLIGRIYQLRKNQFKPDKKLIYKPL